METWHPCLTPILVTKEEEGDPHTISFRWVFIKNIIKLKYSSGTPFVYRQLKNAMRSTESKVALKSKSTTVLGWQCVCLWLNNWRSVEIWSVQPRSSLRPAFCSRIYRLRNGSSLGKMMDASSFEITGLRLISRWFSHALLTPFLKMLILRILRHIQSLRFSRSQSTFQLSSKKRCSRQTCQFNLLIVWTHDGKSSSVLIALLCLRYKKWSQTRIFSVSILVQLDDIILTAQGSIANHGVAVSPSLKILDLEYADDVVCLVDLTSEAQEVLNNLKRSADKYDVRFASSKCKALLQD
jgi:hypothetical protein